MLYYSESILGAYVWALLIFSPSPPPRPSLCLFVLLPFFLLVWLFLANELIWLKLWSFAFVSLLRRICRPISVNNRTCKERDWKSSFIFIISVWMAFINGNLIQSKLQNLHNSYSQLIFDEINPKCGVFLWQTRNGQIICIHKIYELNGKIAIFFADLLPLFCFYSSPFRMIKFPNKKQWPMSTCACK